MKRLLPPVVLAGMFTLVFSAGTPASGQEKPADAGAEIQKIQADFQAKMQEFSKKYQSATTNEERQKLYSTSYPDSKAPAGKVLELVKANPEAEGALPGLQWAFQSGLGAEALPTLEKHFLKKKEIGAFCVLSSYQQIQKPETGEKFLSFLKNVAKENPSEQIKGVSEFAQAKLMGSPTMKASVEDREKLLKAAIPKIGDYALMDRLIKPSAEGLLFELQNLQIGSKAPEIEGEDGEKKPFKLSDYKGKVILLDFWGDW